MSNSAERKRDAKNDDLPAPSLQNVDIYLKLADRAATRFQARRTVEWQVNFAMYTAFGAIILAFIASDKITLDQFGGWVVVTLVVLGALLYFPWIAYIREEHFNDNSKSRRYERAIETFIGTRASEFPNDSAATKALDNRNWHDVFNISQLLEIFFVVALAIGAVLTIHARVGLFSN